MEFAMSERIIQKFKYLIISSDTYPPFRADTAVLFGHEMIQRGHRIDCLLQSKEDCRQPYLPNGMDVMSGLAKQIIVIRV